MLGHQFSKTDVKICEFCRGLEKAWLPSPSGVGRIKSAPYHSPDVLDVAVGKAFGHGFEQVFLSLRLVLLHL